MRCRSPKKDKTSTVYEEKLIVVPKPLYDQLVKYVDIFQPILNEDKTSNRLFTTNGQNIKMNQSNISSCLTSAFNKSKIFGSSDYKRVSCTRIRVAIATFACNEGGVDMRYLAKHFMKNKEKTTASHYNMFANQRHALCLASMIDKSFEVYGGETITLKNEERDALANALRGLKLSSKERILE